MSYCIKFSIFDSNQTHQSLVITAINLAFIRVVDKG